jgi:hypothetical protein
LSDTQSRTGTNMAERKTKAELEEEIKSLREDIDRLDYQKFSRRMVWIKTINAMGICLLSVVAVLFG